MNYSNTSKGGNGCNPLHSELSSRNPLRSIPLSNGGSGNKRPSYVPLGDGGGGIDPIIRSKTSTYDRT